MARQSGYFGQFWQALSRKKTGEARQEPDPLDLTSISCCTMAETTFKISVGRPRPPFLRALGRGEPPEPIEIGGRSYRLLQVYKHDSWAATALYARGAERAVCKFHRQYPAGPFPLAWLGRWFAHRERSLLRSLDAVPGVPRLLPPATVDGLSLPHAVARQDIPGHPLGRHERMPAEFFNRLATLLNAVHARQIAYMDLHKRENVLVVDDGKPYLIDFQISFACPERLLRRYRSLRWLLRLLQASHWYHLQKLRVRHQGGLTAGARRCLRPKSPWWIRWHRRFAVPLRSARRRLLGLLGVRTGKGRVTSESFAEEWWKAI